MMENSTRLTEREDRPPAEQFLHDSIDVGQVLAVTESRKAAGTKNAVDLSLCTLLDIREESHRKEEG